MSRSRLSHSSKLTKEGSRTGRAHCSDTWTQRERDLLNYSLLSLLAAIWQNISKLKPVTFTCTRMSMHFLPGKIRDKWYLTLLRAQWELGTKKRKALEDVHAGVVTYRIFKNKLGIIALCVFINLVLTAKFSLAY